MEFHRIDPGIRGFENQVFECGRCYTMKTVAVRLDATIVAARHDDAPWSAL
jgi:hypothetical protein